MRFTHIRVAALLVALALAVTACGGDDSGEPSEAATTAADVEDEPEDETAAPEDETAATEDEADDAGEPAEASGEPIVVGVAVAQTGAQSVFGLLEQDAMEYAVEQVNELGGVLGRPLELIIEDTGAEVPVGVAAVQSLLAREPVAIAGVTTSGLAFPLVPIIEEAGIPMIHGAQNPDLAADAEGNEWMFRVRTEDRLTARSMYEVAVAEFDFSSPAIIHSDEPVGNGFRDQLTELLEENGYELATVETHDLGPSDLTAQIRSIAESGADMLFVQNFPADAALLARQVNELGLDIPISWGAAAMYSAFDFGLFEPELLAGDIASLDALPTAAPDEHTREWAATLEERSGRSANEQSVSWYSAILMLADAIERAGTTDPEPLRDALADTTGLTEWNGLALPSITLDCDEQHDCLNERQVYRITESGEPEFIQTFAADE